MLKIKNDYIELQEYYMMLHMTDQALLVLYRNEGIILKNGDRKSYKPFCFYFSK